MADYEALLDEHFQMLCQALLVREFQGVQCMPVGMPDGGRDAISPDLHGRNALVFQVKFARRPATVTDIFAWITNAIKPEIDKIIKLRDRGASHYVVITNMGGTSHLDVGTIDRVQAYLDRELPIPARCWWRDDLDRRLDCNFDLKLRYPHLLNGPDIVRLLWESATGGEHLTRRRDALTAYIGHQFNQDSTVRFKQVELDSTALFDLFIDVPARPARIPKDSDFAQEIFTSARSRIQEGQSRLHQTQIQAEDELDDDYEYHPEDDGSYLRISSSARQPMAIGAAALLSDPAFTCAAPRIVLEGAPGQGKSTLIQYLAQIQRWRILYPDRAASEIPQQHAGSPLMLPLKIELRDLALWLNGYDPWAGTSNQAHNRPKTLESALSAHVQRYSGGITFDVADLVGVMKKAPTLLVLDALDEVADLDDRRKVVEEVMAGLLRLEIQGQEIRTVVTSRPTAIANSPTFPSNQFTYLSLAPLKRSLAIEYAGRWVKARRLDSRDSEDLFATLQQKLKSPHMAELAKNTMQLTILLSLMHVRGVSLPDKRTELYYTYIEMFLNREAEKSDVVRDNRRLLLEIHGYIAYYMHARAESNKSTGRIPADGLRQAIQDYLRKEEQPDDLLESLFTGVVERFVALVSRVEGTYEFEVQPLREYFAARFLYDTAPYSPAGREKTGTKPERFDGIAANPYWLNVTRFFAGCFSKGELADLADRICEPITAKELKLTPYPRLLAMSLLQDWALAQSKKATKQVVRAIFDELGIRWATCQSEGRQLFDVVGTRLPVGSGGEYLAQLLYDCLKTDSWTERASGIALLLWQSAPREWVKEQWCNDLVGKSGQALTEWLVIGSWLGVLKDLTSEELATALASHERTDINLAVCGKAGGPLIGGDDTLRRRTARAMLCEACLPRIGPTNYPILTSMFSFVIDPPNWITVLRQPGFGNYYANILRKYDFSRVSSDSPTIRAMADIAQLIPELWRKDIGRELAPWNAITTELVTKFGKSWVASELGVIAGGIRSRSERGAGADQLFLDIFPLPERIRNARRHASDVRWWSAQVDALEDVHDSCLWLMAVLIWARRDTVTALLPEIDQRATGLDHLDKQNLIAASARAAQYAKRSGAGPPVTLRNKLTKLGPATLAALLPRLDYETKKFVVHKRLLHEMDCPQIASACLGVIVEELRLGNRSERAVLESAKSCHEAGGFSTRQGQVMPTGRSDDEIKKWLNSVLADPWKLPEAFLRQTSTIAGSFAPKPVPVMRIAESRRWFSD